LVIPIFSDNNFGLLYAEPVYLQAEGIDFPELKQVILATGEKVVMESSIPEALTALTGYVQAGSEQPAEDREPTSAQPGAPPSDVDAAIEKITGVLDGFKESLSDLEKALEDLKESMGGE